MKSIFIIAIALFFIQCNKANKQSAADDKIIKDYITKNNIAATKTADGLYYIITAPTSGVHAKAGDVASVYYTGKLMNESVFDKNTNSSSPFNFVIGAAQVISGWDEGIALLKKGEKARLFIPSALGYGSSGQGSIPPNAVLQFDVDLVDLN
ncbi:MAG: FKBP-type peptidyl-prolyl cis-trans isomerase [Bacteroidota bacterium]|nr:FKBP-type peptidyl-prolyl cis-trans isomerase [Bacteroidota bacterium]